MSTQWLLSEKYNQILFGGSWHILLMVKITKQTQQRIKRCYIFYEVLYFTSWLFKYITAVKKTIFDVQQREQFWRNLTLLIQFT